VAQPPIRSYKTRRKLMQSLSGICIEALNE
jgi:hypothetical protein